MKNQSLKKSNLVPLFVFCLCLAVILFIPLRIIGYGFLPPADALRHAAKVISGKNWQEILVLRSDIILDTHPGWHKILGIVHQLTNWGVDGLVVFSIVSLFILFSFFPLVFLSRKESWILTLIIAFLAVPYLIMRLFLGRPYIFTMAVLVFILFTWPRFKEKRLPGGLFILTTALISLSTWIHGLWYVLPLIVLCFFLARQWRTGLGLGICTIIGIFLGAGFTGQPWQFLAQTFSHFWQAFSGYKLTRMLALEFQPSSGDVLMILVVLGMLGWRALRGRWERKRVDNPVFILAVSGWILGLYTQRFYSDWGFPATLVWIAQEFQEWLETKINYYSWKRIILTVVAVITLFFISTSDLGDRWTGNLMIEYLSLDNPHQAPWLPEPGGIFYSSDMLLFYQTFYKNPTAPWRYILGFEPTMMPQDDLAIFRKIQRDYNNAEAYQPWVKKMKPQDRLVVRGNPGFTPDIPELEWYYAAKGIWIGRLTRKAK